MRQNEAAAERSILIVDDEALIRFDLTDFFEQAGYQAFEAGNADEAIDVFARTPSIRAVLTDIQMPGSMDGLWLAHHVKSRFPPTILIITSGALSPTGTELPSDSVFVPKPFDPS